MRRVLIVAALVLASCTTGASESVDVVLSEFDLKMQSRLESGMNTLSIRNDGEFGHTVVVANESGEVVAATELIYSGETGELVVNLEPGRYEFTCRIVFQGEDGSLTDHYELGMHSTVTVES